MKRVRVMQAALSLALIALVASLLSGCASWRAPTLEATGITVEALGEQFVKVAAVFEKGCIEPRSISMQACAEFRDFGIQFKQAYPLLVGLWKAARDADDPQMQRSVTEVIAHLATSLSKLAAEGLDAYGRR